MSSAPTVALRAERRRTLFITAAAVPAFALVDLLLAEGGTLWKTFLVRVLWGATLALCGFFLMKASEQGYHRLLLVGSATSPLFYAALCALLGGANSPLFAWSLALPVGIAALLEEELAAVIAASVASMVCGAILLSLSSVTASTFAVWMLLFTASIFIAVRSAVGYRALRLAERAAFDAQLQTQSRLQQSEHRRQHSERLALIGQLAAGVAHEVRNPLTIALLQLDFLDKLAATPDSIERVASVRRALDRVRQIIGDLQNFSRAEPENVELESVRAEDIIRETLRLAEVRLQGVARIERQISDALPNIRVQPRQMSQVLLNLLVNAADALEEQKRETAFIRVAAQTIGGTVRIAIEDNGPGIPAHLMERIFEPFFTTKADKGTGLGLALSREYVERFGGVIAAENREGGGARFVIDLPAV